VFLAPLPGRMRLSMGSGGCARYTRSTTGYQLSAFQAGCSSFIVIIIFIRLVSFFP
jgi:hypothetical protein